MLGFDADTYRPEIREVQPMKCKPRVATRFATIFLLIACLQFVGCQTYRAMPIAGDDPAHAREFRQARKDVVMAAELLNEDEVRAKFYEDLSGRGIVPIVLHIQNQGKRSLTLRRDDVKLRLESGAEFSPVTPDVVIAECRARIGWGYLGLPLVVPYTVVRGNVASFNFELDQDYRQKSLDSFLRVVPGDPPKARALFFRLDPEDMKLLSRSPSLEVPANVEALSEQDKIEPGQSVSYLLSLN